MAEEGKYLGPVDELPFIPTADTFAGEVLQKGGLAGIVRGAAGTSANKLIKTGEKAVLTIKGLVELPVATGTTFTEGQAVEWDNTNKLCVTTAGTFALGKSAYAKASGPTRMAVILNE